MMLGGGFLKNMADTLKYNREILGKKKTPQEKLKESVKHQTSKTSTYDIDMVKLRVSLHLKRSRGAEVAKKIGAVVMIILVVMLLFNLSKKYSEKSSNASITKEDFFKTAFYIQDDSITVLKRDHFKSGPKAMETFLVNGYKHQFATSYYETGERFRSALYYYDTLIQETYFFKDGDTIKGISFHDDAIVYHIRVSHQVRKTLVEFDIIDGKIMENSYHETLFQER
jgi:hypothetical protein